MEATTFVSAKSETTQYGLTLGRQIVSVNVKFLLKLLIVLAAVVTIIIICTRSVAESPRHHINSASSFQSTTSADAGAPAAVPINATATPRTRLAYSPIPPPSGRQCYRPDHIDRELVRLFDDVLSAERRPHNGTNIFFHETTCLNGTARLTVRQACAIESAARANRNTGIYVLYASPAGHERDRPRAAVFDALAMYANVHLRNVDLWTYTLDTPAEQWLRSSALFRSAYPSVHAADFLRLVSLYRFGGTHMDLDFVVRRSFEQLPANYVAEELKGYLANGLMNFGPDGIGHVMAAHVLTEFVQHFNGQVFAANGPALLKRVFHELCRMDNLFECPLIRVLQKEQLYAVYGTKWQRLFDREHAAESQAMFNGSLAVHMWNALSRYATVKVGEGSAYEMLAREFCPLVFATVRGGQF